MTSSFSFTCGADDFEEALRQMAVNEVNLRWQEMMPPYWKPVPGIDPRETFGMMHGKFYMADDESSRD